MTANFRLPPPLIYGHLSSDLIWVRFWPLGLGFTVKRTRPLFSERNGRGRKYYRLPLGWRLGFFGRREGM